MADGSGVPEEHEAHRAGGAQPFALGDDLDALLAALRRANVQIGTREHVAAHTVAAELVARGRVRGIGDLRHALRPLLARTAQEREAFDVVYDAHAPGTAVVPPKPPPGPATEPERRWWLYLLIALALLAAGAAAKYFWTPSGPGTDRPPPPPPGPGDIARDFTPDGQAPVQAKMTNVELLDRIAAAAKGNGDATPPALFDGAPTLEELVRSVTEKPDPTRASIGWPASSYAIKLHEWTGLPLSVPIAIYGKDGRDGTTWARLALALGRIEQPGREPTLASLLEAANANAKARTDAQIPMAYRLAARMHEWLPLADVSSIPKAKLIETVQRGAEKATPPLGGPAGTPLAVDPFHVMRALAISGHRLPPGFHDDSPWRPKRPGDEPSYAWRWAPLLAFLFPVALALFWLANSLALRKAYLRRRPPEVPPLHLDLVSQIGRRLSVGRGQFRRIAQRLQVRTPETTDRIDVPATIAATLASGSRFITPAYAQLYRTPEYLVLIERRTVADQETEHLRALIKRISDVVPVTIYTFQGEPALLDPERAPGRPVLIEQVVAAHSDHRLIILGSGEGLLDPVTLHPRPRPSASCTSGTAYC